MGRGGMRVGAGRPGYRAKAEHLQRVDIRDWHPRGRLWVGSSFSWSWTRGDEPYGSIGVHMFGPASLALQYNHTNRMVEVGHGRAMKPPPFARDISGHWHSRPTVPNHLPDYPLRQSRRWATPATGHSRLFQFGVRRVDGDLV